MLVSNFELIIYPRLERTYQETTCELLITNLEDIAIEFLLEMHVSVFSVRYGSATLGNIYVEIINADGESQPATHEVNLEWIRPIYITIPSKATTLVKMNTPAERELMGYLTLRVPPVRNRSHHLITTQQSTPVKVLLAASRQDFCRHFMEDILDENRKPVYKLLVNSWLSRQCIPIASGKALNEIEPEGIGLTTAVADVINHLHLTDDAKQGMTHETFQVSVSSPEKGDADNWKG